MYTMGVFYIILVVFWVCRLCDVKAHVVVMW